MPLLIGTTKDEKIGAKAEATRVQIKITNKLRNSFIFVTQWLSGYKLSILNTFSV